MPRIKRLQPGAEWNELTTTAADWKAADPGLLATMLGQLHLIRAFEETVLELAGEGLVHGPAHSSIGQEGGAVGSIVSLRSADAVNGSHRGHHQFLAKAITHVTKGTLDPADLVTPEVATVLQRTLAEILGLTQGYCAGRGGALPLQWVEAGAVGTHAIVGRGVPMGAGKARAQKHTGSRELTPEDLRHMRAVRRACAGADDRHGGTIEQPDLAASTQEQSGRRIEDRAERRRKGGERPQRDSIGKDKKRRIAMRSGPFHRSELSVRVGVFPAGRVVTTVRLFCFR